MSYSSEIPKEIMKKIKAEFKELPLRIRECKIKGDFLNTRLYRKIDLARVFHLKNCSVEEYIVPLLDKNGKPLNDEEGKRDFLTVDIYFHRGKCYRYKEVLDM